MSQYALSVLSSFDSRIRQAHRILIACDFDGTLCPIAPSPSEVKLAPYMIETLRAISESERMALAVISGRELDDLATRVPLNLILAGNHGLEIRGRGITFEHPGARQLRAELSRCCAELRDIVGPWKGAWIEDKGLTATVHYRAVPTEQQNVLRRAVRGHAVGRIPRIGLRPASKALELYPKLGWGKGEALRMIQAEVGPFDLSVAIGDDSTDENMFLEDPAHINIKVGAGKVTKANFHLYEPSGVATFLTRMLHLGQGSEMQLADGS